MLNKHTIYEKVDSVNPEADVGVFMKAADIIRNGGLVAFPTETVYGLGANALDGFAAKRIYTAKGRPSDNPLIVHIADVASLHDVSACVPSVAEKLTGAFWPGPLTIILKKSGIIPYTVTGGLDTVAVRFPANKCARLLISCLGSPIAAPSANISGKPSPTSAVHVLNDFDGKIDMIIDGGACEFGLESTIVDLSGGKPCLLRPGSITKEMLDEVLSGEIDIADGVLDRLSDAERPRSPGQKYRHYSPNCELVIVKGEQFTVADKINRLIAANNDSRLIGVIATDETRHLYSAEAVVISAGSRNKPENIAAGLFGILREFDRLSCDIVYSESFDQEGLGLAIMNRLCKASGYNIINCD